MKTKHNELIICPYCHYEYLPAEIFIPSALLGRPKDIIRDIDGQILEYEGVPQDLTETYICDKCNRVFGITMKMSFTTETTKLGNIDEEYTTQLKKADLFEG